MTRSGDVTQRDTLRTKWDRSEETLGAWTFIPSPVTAESCARAGFDYVCIDTQHGAIGYDSVVPMIQAIELGGGIPIARVPWNEPGIIGKMLDAGCHGIIIPMVNTAEEGPSSCSSSSLCPARQSKLGACSIRSTPRRLSRLGRRSHHCHPND